MENLNAEQIIKALECCYSDDLSCIDCPYQDTAKYKECGHLNKNALSLIKELTEELADCKAIAEGYQKQFEDCAEDRAKLTEENERLRAENAQIIKEAVFSPMERAHNTLAVRADTVRKMQERLHEQFRKSVAYTRSYIHEDIDQIAKEMLEGK